MTGEPSDGGNYELAGEDLARKVRSWFEKEGYPLEFRTAQVFQRGGFATTQGYYCHGSGGEFLEIDVLAHVDSRSSCLNRVSYVVECKWSRDKPWVIFTSPDSWMLESACVAQTVASKLGDAVTFCLAGEPGLHTLETFARRIPGGFGGRRAFEKRDSGKDDQFYRAIRSVVNKAVMVARSADKTDPSSQPVPSQNALVFPVIVVDGEIFEVSYAESTDSFQVVQADSARVYWRGSEVHERWIAPVDIVKLSALEQFV